MALKEAITLFWKAFSFSEKELNLKKILNHELRLIVGDLFNYDEIDFEQSLITHQELQSKLAKLNEKGEKRKTNGVYFTPEDTVNFITKKTIETFFENKGCAQVDLYSVTFFDPTCGTGEFLVSALKWKIQKIKNLDKKNIRYVVSSIFGNDIDKISLCVTKIRILAILAQYTSILNLSGIAKIINNQFTDYDAVISNNYLEKKFDIILGNPPYVEDSKYGGSNYEKFGNIYANVILNSSFHLKKEGVMGFVIPISYVATPRMNSLRKKLIENTPKQYLFNYADRPDCLFTSVHQKLTIFLGVNTNCSEIYTSRYQYWYATERNELFEKLEFIKHNYKNEKFIPKIGNATELSIYKKISNQKRSLKEVLKEETNNSFYLNMRATFWIKAFSHKKISNEYKKFCTENDSIKNFVLCLLNSSLFWWFWCCISDCWHITNKELEYFRIPYLRNNDFKKLITNLERKLENTKKFIGSKQTEFEYKHRLCLKEIHEIDDLICSLYELSSEETSYIKKFALKYRVGGDNEGY